jgi:RHS repeat-associated protein
MTEMAPKNNTMVAAHNNVWAGGKLLATYDNDGVHFYVDDPLGTRRVQTDYTGVPEQTCQSLPYGDGETCAATPTEHLFTGKERDAESGNDYFGARYYGSSMGRFMSPDWAAKAEPVPYAKLDDPQSLNLYAYVLNNPLTRIDPDGHEVDLNGPQKDKAQEQKRILSNLKPSERGLFASSTDKNGKTTLTLNKDAAGGFKGKHSSAYNLLAGDIASKNIVSISIQATLADAAGNVQSVKNDFGGGVTIPDGHGNFSVVLSPDGHNGPVNGLPGLPPAPDPVGIIAGHELFGHVRLGSPFAAGEPEAVGVENQLRQEHVPPMPLRGPAACFSDGSCVY